MNSTTPHHHANDPHDPHEADSDDGRWRVADGEVAGATPLSWEPRVPPWRRILGSISVPGAVAIIVFVLALAVTAVIMLRSLSGSAAGGAAALSIAPGGAAESIDAGGDATRPDSDASVETLIVHLVGEVERPGVVELPPGARVLDAITEAGGPTPAADLSAVNLARPVVDGEQIAILDAEAAAAQQASPLSPLPDSAQTGPQSDADGRVNVNTATLESLTQLSGIGPALAQRILDWREANGRFADVDQLLEVSGIGAKTLEKFRDRVTV